MRQINRHQTDALRYAHCLRNCKDSRFLSARRQFAFRHKRKQDILSSETRSSFVKNSPTKMCKTGSRIAYVGKESEGTETEMSVVCWIYIVGTNVSPKNAFTESNLHFFSHTALKWPLFYCLHLFYALESPHY